jgi:hypothetical protein
MFGLSRWGFKASQPVRSQGNNISQKRLPYRNSLFKNYNTLSLSQYINAYGVVNNHGSMTVYDLKSLIEITKHDISLTFMP